MEVRIGVIHTMKELSVELDGDADEIAAAVDRAIASDEPSVWLIDNKGRRVGVPTDKIAYVEISLDDGSKQVGFGRS